MRKLIYMLLIMGMIALSSNAIADIKSGDTCQLKSNHIVAFMYKGGLIKFVKVTQPIQVTLVVPIPKDEAGQLHTQVKTDWQDGFVTMFIEGKEVKHYLYAPLSALQCK